MAMETNRHKRAKDIILEIDIGPYYTTKAHSAFALRHTEYFHCAAINIRVRAMQFRMASHQTKKGKHESNTSDVLRIGEEQAATRDRELSWQHTGNPGSVRHI